MHWTIKRRPCRFKCALGLIVSLLATPFFEVVFAGVQIAPGGGALPTVANVGNVPASKSTLNHARRVKLVAGKSVEVVPGGPIVSAAVADSKIATAETNGSRASSSEDWSQAKRL